LNNEQTVFIIDDDVQTRQSLAAAVRSMDLDCETFASAMDFLNAFDPMRAGCLVLDVCLAGMSGLELLERVNDRVVYLPAIVTSARRDVATVVRAIRAGAVDFLEKPPHVQSLRRAVREALNWDAENRPCLVQLVKVRHRLENLSPGEYAVLEKLIGGESNKVIAAELGVSVRTVEVRRANIMRKMKACSLADLICMITRASFIESGVLGS
jgi:two-component system response regulator FixJ